LQDHALGCGWIGHAGIGAFGTCIITAADNLDFQAWKAANVAPL
jgi:hypothetical protein